MPQLRPKQARLSRRTLLAGSLATVLFGCKQPDEETSREPTTVSSLTRETPFYIAHRGGGGNWPEMTAYAYEQASRQPKIKALEISVCISADGVLVCSHDPTTTRVTGVEYVIANEKWTTLSKLKVKPTNTTDPMQPAQPLARFDDIVRAYADQFVLFVEPKVEAATSPLMTRMAQLNQPERVVWKQWLASPEFEVAKQHGFATWAYVLNEPNALANLKRLAGSETIDMLGAPREEPDNFALAIVRAADDQHKKTIMWDIRNLADRARALRLGCKGLMTSNVREVLGAP
jgi:glycerophosphoryl diester phosphodiesterase